VSWEAKEAKVTLDDIYPEVFGVALEWVFADMYRGFVTGALAAQSLNSQTTKVGQRRLGVKTRAEI
jgi:hypothetical protein